MGFRVDGLVTHTSPSPQKKNSNPSASGGSLLHAQSIEALEYELEDSAQILRGWSLPGAFIGYFWVGF